MSLAGTDWLFALGAALLAAAGVALLLWALWSDWLRGVLAYRRTGTRRRRCPKCWYDMAGVEGLRCLECGREAKRELRFRRSRRRWAWLPAAVVIFAGAHTTARIPDIRANGWVRAIPTSVLACLAPVGESAWTWMPGWPGRRYATPKDSLLIEMLRRCDARTPARWQWQVFLDRAFAAKPEFLESVVLTRDKWPEGVPIEAQFWAPPFLRTTDDLVIRARIHGSGELWARRRLGALGAYASPDHWQPRFGEAPSGEISASFDVQVLAGAALTRTRSGAVASADASTARLVWRGTVRTISLGGPVESVMVAMPSPLGDAAVAGLTPRLGREPDGRIRLVTRLIGYHLEPDDSDWALGARCEVRRDGAVVATGEMVYPMSRPGRHVSYGSPTFWTDLQWQCTPPRDADISSAVWEVRLVGDPLVALRDLRRSTCWGGEVTVRVEHIMDREPWDR